MKQYIENDRGLITIGELIFVKHISDDNYVKMLAEIEEGSAKLTESDKDQARKNIESRNYLTETDWYVIRNYDTGAEIPADIKAKRQECRDIIK